MRHPFIILHQATFAPFIEYFETQWIGVFQGVRQIRKGGDSISWNCFKQVKDGLLKTTSSLEGWHSQFAKRVRVKKPKFNKIMTHLKIQQSISARTFKTEMQDMDDPPTKKKTKAVTKCQDVSKAVLKYYAKDRKLEHLMSISIALSKNNQLLFPINNFSYITFFFVFLIFLIVFEVFLIYYIVHFMNGMAE